MTVVLPPADDDDDAQPSPKTDSLTATVVFVATAVCLTALLLTVAIVSTATVPPLTLTGKASPTAFLASMSTLPTATGTDIDSPTASFSPLWLRRPAPPYCGASHTNDRKATGSGLKQQLPPFGGTSEPLVRLPQVLHTASSIQPAG